MNTPTALISDEHKRLQIEAAHEKQLSDLPWGNRQPPAIETLWVTDAELIRRSGIPEKKARRLIRELDRLDSGFPPKNKVCGDLRYWPAVKEFFANRTAKLISSKNGRNSNVRAA